MWYITYTSNFLVFKNSGWTAPLIHTWTLSVEEQFYLLWPFFIVFTRKGRLLWLLAFLFTLSAGLYIVSAWHSFWYSVLLPTCFFSFCAGGILSFLKLEKKQWLESKWLTVLLVISLLVKFYFITQLTSIPLLNSIAGYSRIINTVFAFFLINFLDKHPGIMGFRVTSYLGKISYGIYLYHYVLSKSFFDFYPSNPLVNYFLKFITLILISILSFELLEKRLIGFGKKQATRFESAGTK